MSLLSLAEIRAGVLAQFAITAPAVFDESNFHLEDLQVNTQRLIDTPEIGLDYAASRGMFLKDAAEFAIIRTLPDYEFFSYDFWLMCKKDEFHTLYFAMSKAINLYAINTMDVSATGFRMQIGGNQGNWKNKTTGSLMMLFSTRWDWALPSNLTN